MVAVRVRPLPLKWRMTENERCSPSVNNAYTTRSSSTIRTGFNSGISLRLVQLWPQWMVEFYVVHFFPRYCDNQQPSDTYIEATRETLARAARNGRENE